MWDLKGAILLPDQEHFILCRAILNKLCFDFSYLILDESVFIIYFYHPFELSYFSSLLASYDIEHFPALNNY